VSTLRDRLRRASGWFGAPSASLLAKTIGAFLVVLALASLLTQLFETRLTRIQLQEQAEALFSEQGEIFDLSLEQEATRTGLLMRAVLEGQFGSDPNDVAPTDLVPVPGDGGQERPRIALANVRRAAGMQFGAIVDVTTGGIAVGLATRETIAPPGPEAAAAVFRTPGTSQRVVPLERDGRYGVAYVLPIGRTTGTAGLQVIGYPLDDVRAREIAMSTGVDEVDIVVDGAIVASTAGRHGQPALGDVGRPRTTQLVAGGRMVRYVVLGVDRPWDHHTVVGLIVDDPLASLDSGLAQTRALMVVLMVAFGGALALAAAGLLTRPIARLTETATAIAGGDLERSFRVDRNDELGRLGDALERMRRALRAQLLVIRQQAEALQDAARRIVGVQDAERQRVAGELHDGIQQQLVVLRMQVGVARSQLEREPERIEEVTRGLAASIDQLLDDLRATGQALFPAILADRGLSGALFSLAGRVEVPLDLDLEPDPLPRFAPEVETNAYFLVSEAVTNALKHADATRVTVMVRHEDTLLRLQVEDDGLGFEPSATAHRGGLIHLRDRVNALGGTLQLVAEPGAGTRVTALLPVDTPAPAGRTDDQVVRGSVGGALEVEEDRGDAPVEVDLLGEAELPEDGVGVLLDRSFADRQLPGDRGVPPS
jgi:signal transduction histidine kinase